MVKRGVEIIAVNTFLSAGAGIVKECNHYGIAMLKKVSNQED